MTSNASVGLAPQQPLRYTGAPVNIMTTTQAPRPPTIDDRGYPLNTVWRVSESNMGGTVGDEWILVEFTGGDAIWRQFAGASNNGIESLTGDSGGAVFGDSSNNIDDLGGTAITTVGVPGSHSITSNINYPKQTYVAPVQPSDNFLYYRSSGTAYNTANLSDLLASPRASNLHTENLGITYAAGTYTITAADGTALSATNPAYICIQSNITPQKYITVALTQPYSFIDSTGSSTIIGNTFGTSAGVQWGNQRPFFLYAVCDAADANPQIFLAQDPTKSIVTGNLAKVGSAIALVQTDCFFFNNPTVASYANMNCILIGSLAMQKNTSDDWALSFSVGPSQVGINKFPDEVGWRMPPGQFGADAGGYQLGAGGGTAPTYGSFTCIYYLHRDGTCIVAYTFGGATAGAGGQVLQTVLPYVSGFTSPGLGVFQYDPNAGGGPLSFQWRIPSGAAVSSWYYFSSTVNTQVVISDIMNSDNNFMGYCRFSAFGQVGV